MTPTREHALELRHRWWQGLVFGVAGALLLLAVDALLFASATIRRMPELSAHPTLAARMGIAIIGSVLEELYFRVLVATSIAGLAWLVLRQVGTAAAPAAQWTGTLTAALYVGLWHLGSPADLWRVLAVNAISNVLYGWLYWRRGLEAAILAHMVGTATLFIAVPALR